MPFCQNCGRPLNPGEVCRCTAQQGGAAPQQSPYMNQPYSYQSGMQPQPQPPKKSGAGIGCLIAAAIAIPVFLAVIGVLAAIFVPAMIGHTKKANVSAANSYARAVVRAAQTVLVDMDYEDKNVGGVYIISNTGLEPVPPFDEDEFLEEMYVYISEAVPADAEFFAVVEDAEVVYAAVWESEHGYVGCYPTPSTTDGPVSITGEQYYEWDMSGLTADAQAEITEYIESQLDLDGASYE